MQSIRQVPVPTCHWIPHSLTQLLLAAWTKWVQAGGYGRQQRWCRVAAPPPPPGAAAAVVTRRAAPSALLLLPQSLGVRHTCLFYYYFFNPTTNTFSQRRFLSRTSWQRKQIKTKKRTRLFCLAVLSWRKKNDRVRAKCLQEGIRHTAVVLLKRRGMQAEHQCFTGASGRRGWEPIVLQRDQCSTRRKMVSGGKVWKTLPRTQLDWCARHRSLKSISSQISIGWAGSCNIND